MAVNRCVTRGSDEVVVVRAIRLFDASVLMVSNYYRPRWGLCARRQTQCRHVDENVVSAGSMSVMAWFRKPSANSKRRGRTFSCCCSFAYSTLASFRMGMSGSEEIVIRRFGLAMLPETV